MMLLFSPIQATKAANRLRFIQNSLSLMFNVSMKVLSKNFLFKVKWPQIAPYVAPGHKQKHGSYAHLSYSMERAAL